MLLPGALDPILIVAVVLRQLPNDLVRGLRLITDVLAGRAEELVSSPVSTPAIPTLFQSRAIWPRPAPPLSNANSSGHDSLDRMSSTLERSIFKIKPGIHPRPLMVGSAIRAIHRRIDVGSSLECNRIHVANRDLFAVGRAANHQGSHRRPLQMNHSVKDGSPYAHVSGSQSDIAKSVRNIHSILFGVGRGLSSASNLAIASVCRSASSPALPVHTSHTRSSPRQSPASGLPSLVLIAR